MSWNYYGKRKDQKQVISEMYDLALSTASATPVDYAKYRDNPLKFCMDKFGETYSDDIKKLMESVRDNEITVAVSANATGKTHSAARICLWFYKCFEGAQVYTTAAPPEDNLKRLLWGEIRKAVSKAKNMFVADTVNAMEIFENREDNRFVVGKSIPMSGTASERESKFSGKHAPNLMFVFDEADAIPNEVYKGADGCSSGGLVRWLLMFNPKHKSGYAYRLIREGLANVVHLNAFNHPNVIEGKEIYPGAVSRDKTIQRIHLWTRKSNPYDVEGMNTFKIPDYLVGATVKNPKTKQPYPPLEAGFRVIEQPEFYYMTLGQYPAMAGNQLIHDEWIESARSRWDLYTATYGKTPPIGISGVQGLDPAEFGDDYTYNSFRYGDFLDELVGWGGVDTSVTADRAAEEYKSRRIKIINVDSIGVGAGIPPILQRLGCAVNRVMFTEQPTMSVEEGQFGNQRDQMYWAFRTWLREGGMLPPDPELIEEIQIVTYSKNETTGKIKILHKDGIGGMKSLLGRSPDRLESVVLSFSPNKLFFENAKIHD